MDADQIARFMAATEKATQYIVNNPVKSWEIFSATSTELQDELNKRAWLTRCHGLRCALRAMMPVVMPVSSSFCTTAV